MEKVNLHQVIDTEMLQKILDSFGGATGLAAITVDFRGKPVTQYSEFSNFCKLIREDPRWREKCYQCDAYGGLEAVRREEPYIYRCHTGLVDFAIPIIVNGQYMGSIMSGQAKFSDSEMEQLDFIVKETTSWRDNEEIVKAYNEIPISSYNKVAASAQMMFQVANYMVEKELMRLIQEELNTKNMKLIEQMKARADLEKELKDKEIKALQPQVNLHFLFNVLNTISRLAIIENAPKTQEILFTLTETLQYGFENINQMVKLEDEIAHIERYLKIQSIRFGDRIRFHFQISDEIKGTRLPAMILQAIVHNAIKHALEPKEEGGELHVIGYAMDDNAIIEIKDNGTGIPPEKLDRILEVDKNDTVESTGMGIAIANQILFYHFGQEYQLQIENNPAGGTTVKIKLPKKSRGVSNAQSALGR